MCIRDSLTPVLYPYLPVRIQDLVGVQTGFVQKLLNNNPLVLIKSILGVLGFINPSLYPLMASFPRSSAIMKMCIRDRLKTVELYRSGYTFIDLGTSNSLPNNEINYGVLQFKAKNGGKAFIVESYELLF